MMSSIRTLLVILSGCVGSAVQLAAADDLSGCWQGQWCSTTTGHRGPLFATLTKIDECHYQANFSGRFFRIIPFRYSVVLNVTGTGEVTELAGQSYMGRRYGTFHYFATASDCQFNASYTSCKDCGTFNLTRICAATSCAAKTGPSSNCSSQPDAPAPVSTAPGA